MSDTLFDTFVPTGVTLKAGAAPVSNPASSGITTSSHPPSAPDSSSVGSPAGTDSAASVRPGTPGDEAPAGGPPPVTSDGLDYWQGREIPEDDRAGFDYLGSVLRGSGVRQSVGNAAVDWLYAARELGDNLTAQAAAHRYDLSRYGFSGIDAAYANHFATAMHAKGATQREVEALLNAYVDGQRRVAKQSAPARAQAVKDKASEALDLDDIRQVMRTDRKRYNRDESMQARYRALLAARS